MFMIVAAVLPWSCGFQTKVDAASVPDIKRWINGEIKYRAGQEFVIRFGRGYFKDTLDKMTTTDKEEEVNAEKRHSKNDEDEAKAEDETGVSKLKVSQYF